MVLPLIPLALIAAGTLSGTSGAGLGVKGALDIRSAKKRVHEAIEIYQARHTSSQDRAHETNEGLKRYGLQQQRALIEVVTRMADFLRRNEKQVREHERLLVDGIDASAGYVTLEGKLKFDPLAWISGVVGSTSAAMGASAGVTAAATSFGVASTGAAISGLSGAAAQSATMAWLGGGSLAAGGGGIALGTAALNFVTIGPALLVGGLTLSSQGRKAVTNAEEQKAQIDVAIAELNLLDVRLDAVDTRTQELSSILHAVTDRAVQALDLLESEPFEAQVHVTRFQEAMLLTRTVRDLVATPIVDSEGELTDDSEVLRVKYRKMTEETTDE